MDCSYQANCYGITSLNIARIKCFTGHPEMEIKRYKNLNQNELNQNVNCYLNP